MAFRKYLSASVFCPWERRIKHSVIIVSTAYKNTTLSSRARLPLSISSVPLQTAKPTLTITINLNKQTWNTRTASVILLSSCVVFNNEHCHAWHGGPDGAKAHSLHTFICANNTSRAHSRLCVWPDLYEARQRAKDGNGTGVWKTVSVIIHIYIGIFSFT